VTRVMLMLVVATAMAVLLAGCSSSQSEDQGSSQGSKQEDGSSQQTSEPMTNEALVDSCANSGSSSGQQEEASAGEVSNGEIAFTRKTAHNGDIYVIDGDSDHETRLTHTARLYEGYPVWSPDGQKIAFTTSGADSPLYVMNGDGTNKTQLTADVSWVPSWSPDGGKIAFTTGDQDDLSVINADGTHKVSLITASFAGKSEGRTLFGRPVWSPTGNKIAFASRTLEEGYGGTSASASAPSPLDEGLTGIYLINVDGTGLCKLTGTESLAYGLVWSPDGEQVAFHDEDKTNVINAEGSGRKLLIEGHSAAWSPDGQKIAFVNETSVPNVWLLKVINPDGSGARPLADTAPMSIDLLLAWSPDGENIAFPCPPAHGAESTDLCVTNADGTELKRIALNISYGGAAVEVSWGRE
jgi:Tol biopolymer transport system component